MYIDRLHLKGFKSFGTSQELLFSPGLTAIVGPNGSGKSNLLDALRWVLGEGNPQRLRIGRQSDLLFSGSVSLPPAAQAEVALSLRGDPGEQLRNTVLKRSYTLDGGTVLSVDGTRVRLSDLDGVKRLWRLEGDQFAFIGQGEVAEAIQQRPSQKRAHLEVLFGIDQYRKKRIETSLKLEAASVETLRLETLLAELGNRRKELVPLVERASRARKITTELEEKRRDYYFFRRFMTEEALHASGKEMTLLRMEEALRSRWKELWGRLSARFLREREDLEERLRGLEGEMEGLRAKRNELGRNCLASSSSIREIRSRRRALEVESEGLAARIRLLRDEQREILEKEGELSRKHGEALDGLRGLRQAAAEMKASFEREEARRKYLASSLACLSGEKETLESRILSKETFFKECGADLEECRKTLAALGEMEALLRRELEELSIGEEKAVGLHGDAYARCRQTASLMQQARKEVSSLESSTEALQSAAASAYPEPVRFLASAWKLGKLDVPVTVAADSFSCPPDITSALEAYLGGRQYWILVRTLAEAGKCIQLLKERRAGRATFLPLERSRPRFPDRRFFLPEQGIVGWALDLVSPSEEWHVPVAHLLGDLLIVQGYGDGASLSKRGAPFPMVSLDGEVFTTSGSVSGGRTRQSPGALERRGRILEAGERIGFLRKEITALEKRLAGEEEEERARSREKEELAASLKEKGKRLEEALRAFRLEEARRARLEEERQEALRDKERFGGRISALEGEMGVLRKEQEGLLQGGDGGAILARLSEEESKAALLEERLAGVRILRERGERELSRGEERHSLIARELEETVSREMEEKSRLSAWGRAQYGIFRRAKEAAGELAALRDRERALSRRASRIAERSRMAAEKAGAAAEKAAALAMKREKLLEELGQLVEMWEEQYPFSAGHVPSPERGEAAASAVRRLERDLRALGTVDWGALSEDQSLSERVAFLAEQLADVRNGMEELRNIVEETDKQVGEVFSKALGDINGRFDTLFRRLFGGGEARLQIASSQDGEGSQWDAGVEIAARPPGKRLQSLAQLSGGEQTLTAIAYLFATMDVAGVPLAVLDEVDAALDESNLLRFGDLAREYARPEKESGRGIQILVMTHRRATMERADILYGVTLAEPGLSRIVGIRLEDWVDESPSRLRGARETKP